jgi:DNA-binding XRE family transcriptional regulator
MSDMVTIPRAEYDRLRPAAEDLADLRAFDAAMTDGRESIPAEYVKRIIDGETPVRALRDWRGLSASELARRAGLHRVVVHEIETGKKRGSIDTMKKVAGALGVMVDDLI